MIDTDRLSDTQKDILSHCRYGYWLNTFQQRYYSRMNTLLNFLQVALGATVFGSLFAETNATQIAGVAVMLVGTLQLVIPFGENAAVARRIAHEFSVVQGEIATLDEKIVADRVRHLQDHGVEAFRAIELLAMNRVCDWSGLSKEKEPLTPGARFVSLFL